MFHAVLRTLGHAYPKMSVFVYLVRLSPGTKQALLIQSTLECSKVVQKVLEYLTGSVLHRQWIWTSLRADLYLHVLLTLDLFMGGTPEI